MLATNIAETSLTVPGIRSVVDSGLARVSRYSHRTKVQRLPIEAISKASANQRAGRCGRAAAGTCIRLYSEEDFDARPEFTDPEILRTSLASVILQMAAIGLGEIEAFPFLEPPDSRSIADGRTLLEELGAFERRAGRLHLTPIGRQLARLPIDPRLGRMVPAAEERNCLREVTIIAAALAVQDPRERPAEKAQLADECHQRFVVADSDFLGFVKLWEYLAEIQAELSGNQFRKRCRAEYLNVLRVREWQDVVGQIRQTLRATDAKGNTEPAKPDAIHQALLAGLLSQIGMRDRVRSDYQGARNARFQIGRGSALARRQPAWVMAGALIETERTWARTVARIEPSWAERVAGHLVRRSYSEPWWDAKRGEAISHERVTLYGLPIVAGRQVSFARIDPRASREMFIRHALIDGEWTSEHAFLVRNRARVERVRRLEERVRRAHVFAGDEALFDFYDSELPVDVTGGKRFEQWWKAQRATSIRMRWTWASAPCWIPTRGIDLSAYPRHWQIGDLELPLRYRWAPGAEDDGVTVTIPLANLATIDAAAFSWNIPGYRSELIAALLRGLPKPVRRRLVPSADAVREVAAMTGPENGALFPAVARSFAPIAGVPVAERDVGPRGDSTLPADALRGHRQWRPRPSRWPEPCHAATSAARRDPCLDRPHRARARGARRDRMDLRQPAKTCRARRPGRIPVARRRAHNGRRWHPRLHCGADHQPSCGHPTPARARRALAGRPPATPADQPSEAGAGASGDVTHPTLRRLPCGSDGRDHRSPRRRPIRTRPASTH